MKKLQTKITIMKNQNFEMQKKKEKSRTKSIQEKFVQNIEKKEEQQTKIKKQEKEITKLKNRKDLLTPAEEHLNEIFKVNFSDYPQIGFHETAKAFYQLYPKLEGYVKKNKRKKINQCIQQLIEKVQEEQSKTSSQKEEIETSTVRKKKKKDQTKSERTTKE